MPTNAKKRWASSPTHAHKSNSRTVSESFFIPDTNDKATVYEALKPQLKSLLEGEKNQLARCANFLALLKEAFGFLWIGFYWVDNDEELVLGAFQGPLACMRIRYGRGVCGTAWKNGSVQIVPDVNAFPGHIACSSRSRSEIVIPIRQNNKIIGLLDVDSELYNTFDQIDATHLTAMLRIVIG